LRSGDSTYILSAVNRYNDGEWHHVYANMNDSASLYVDGCMVDDNNTTTGGNYTGYWIIGRNDGTKSVNGEYLSEYFKGSVCEVDIKYLSQNPTTGQGKDYGEILYKFDEGKGVSVTDYAGNNSGALKGSSQIWFTANTLSFVLWEHNIITQEPGTYTLYANLKYAGGPPEGVEYMLGRFLVEDPFPGHLFAYKLNKGFGYFNEGTELINHLDFHIDYTSSDSADWVNDFVKYTFLTPEHYVVEQKIFTYTDGNTEGELPIDMGDAPQGSYLSIEVGYHTSDDYEYVVDNISIPVYLNPMLAPIVSGDFGPFDQAIAPGSMLQPNTFIVTTEILSDLNRIRAVFTDKYDKFIGDTEAVKINDTTWHISYDMGTLSPPVSKLNIEYYLGQNPHPALVQGPIAITIHKTRPKWFDFIADGDFHNVEQYDTLVYFSVRTPMTSSGGSKYLHFNKAEEVILPSWIPLIGNAASALYPPVAEAELKYNIPNYKLKINGDPEVTQVTKVLSAGTGDKLAFHFNFEGSNKYLLDKHNDLIATQNHAFGGSFSGRALRLKSLTKRISNVLKLTGAANPEGILVKPSFQLRIKGSYEYSARVNLKTDTLTGGWGSAGDLDIDANPHHTQAYNNSASYHFNSFGVGLEFDIGVEFFEGFASAYFGLDSRLVMGFGKSYVTYPNNDSSSLKAGAFQIYGRFFYELLWGWYEKNLWGPKLFCSHNFWDDDLSDCFPPAEKKDRYFKEIPAKSSWSELSDEILPVRKFSQMPMPVPQPKIRISNDLKLFSWVERGKSYGERILKTHYLDNNKPVFSDAKTIELNNNALNNPSIDAISKNLGFFCWAQTRYDNQTMQDERTELAMQNFLKAQDIWFAIYDMETDVVLLSDRIEDEWRSITSGRAEANPELAVLSDTEVMIIWQVADLDLMESEIWYLLIENNGSEWIPGEATVLTKLDGIATQLHLASPVEDYALLCWMNTSKNDNSLNKIVSATWNGYEWAEINTVIDDEDHYYNYFNMQFKDGLGALVVSAFIEDSLINQYEKLLLVPYNDELTRWNEDEVFDLHTDSIHHLQYPSISIGETGVTTIAFKVEEMIGKDVNERISQIDLLYGNLFEPENDWIHIEANKYVCDTNKQLADIQLGYVGSDTLMILTNEYPMIATNVNFNPVNGVFFGDPYMNLVLRSFKLGETGEVSDVPESEYFLGINEINIPLAKAKLYQNYPNPCNDFTTITFDIPDRTECKLELFDMTGNRLAVLIENTLNTGRYEVELNTSLLKPGTYIYKLTTDDTATSKADRR